MANYWFLIWFLYLPYPPFTDDSRFFSVYLNWPSISNNCGQKCLKFVMTASFFLFLLINEFSFTTHSKSQAFYKIWSNRLMWCRIFSKSRIVGPFVNRKSSFRQINAKFLVIKSFTEWLSSFIVNARFLWSSPCHT